jgi:hypothetical protein
MNESTCRELSISEISGVSGGVGSAPLRYVWRQIMIRNTIALVEKVGQQTQDAAKEIK